MRSRAFPSLIRIERRKPSGLAPYSMPLSKEMRVQIDVVRERHADCWMRRSRRGAKVVVAAPYQEFPMMIGRLILINSILMLLVLGNAQAANITMAVTTNFPMPGNGIAALFRQTNRYDTILSFGESGEHFRQINKPHPTAFARADLAKTASRFSNATSFMRRAGSCCGDRALNSQIAPRRSRCHSLQNCRPSVNSRLLVA